MFNHRLVHFLVIFITCFLLFINLTVKTKAGGLTDVAGNTIIAGLINSEFSNTDEAGQLVVETFDSELTISPTQQSYLDNLESIRPQARVDMNNNPDEEEWMPMDQNDSPINKPEIAKTTITPTKRIDTITHTVASGDSISTIAQEYGISVNTILWENNLTAYSIIRPGDQLSILPVSGISHKIGNGETLSYLSNKYDVDQVEIAEANNINTNATLKIGQALIIPGGRQIIAPKPSSNKNTQPTYTGLGAIRSIVQAPDSAPVAGNKMNWPTVGKTITQYYSWKHTGLDVANKIGTAIYASDSGTIEVAGWGTGYGNQIVIDHGGGKKTRYAHLSQFYVEKGDTVTKGQTVAAMGSTGWSTGSHLHYEVIINGVKYNPLNYIK